MASRPISLVIINQAETLRDDMIQGLHQYYNDLMAEWSPVYPGLRTIYNRLENDINDQQFLNLSARAIEFVVRVKDTKYTFNAGGRVTHLAMGDELGAYQMLARVYQMKALQLLRLEDVFWAEVRPLRQPKQQQQQQGPLPQQTQQQQSQQQGQTPLPIVQYTVSDGFTNAGVEFSFDNQNLEIRYRDGVAYLRGELRKVKEENEALKRNVEGLEMTAQMRDGTH